MTFLPGKPRKRLPHPSWDDYYRAMVNDRRLLCRVHVDHTYAGGAWNPNISPDTSPSS